MPPTNAKPNLNESVRNNVAQFILTYWNRDKLKLKHGAINKASKMFRLHRNFVNTLGNQSLELMNLGLPVYLTNRKKCTIRKKWKVFDETFFMTLALKKRKTIRRCALALKVGRATFWRWKKCMKIRRHSSAIKVTLTTAQKFKRLMFCLAALEKDIVPNKIKFKSMHHTVHIDEKWLYLTRANENYYLAENEPIPHRDCVNKHYILKVMFLCVVCRPIYDAEGNELFDWKIGMYPFTHQVPAQRSSINRVAGTNETKIIPSITRAVTKEFVINKVIPDLKAIWPLMEGGRIDIQQDNAPVHIQDDDPDFRAAASSDGFDIHLVNQPPKSPDMNVNDLGWFRALQTIQEESSCVNVDELVEAVMGSFELLEPKKLNFVYLSLQATMIETMKQRGHNNYKLPHMAKEKLLREGRLPVDLQVDIALVQQCVDYLRAAASSDGFDIHLVNQPPKSPDMNVNDLGWFRALQTIQEESSCVNVDELVEAVMGSFELLEPKKLNFVYLSLQATMIETMKQRGHNNYKLPHMAKEKLLREGRLPVDLQVDIALVQQCVDYLREAGFGEEMTHIVEKLTPLVF